MNDEGDGCGMVEAEIGIPAIMFEFISRQPGFSIIAVDYIPHWSIIAQGQESEHATR